MAVLISRRHASTSGNSYTTPVDATDNKFRRFLEEHHLSYVVAVPKSQRIGAGRGGRIRVGTATAQAPLEAWKRCSCGDGTKGMCLYDWALATVIFEAEPG